MGVDFAGPSTDPDSAFDSCGWSELPRARVRSVGSPDCRAAHLRPTLRDGLRRPGEGTGSQELSSN